MKKKIFFTVLYSLLFLLSLSFTVAIAKVEKKKSDTEMIRVGGNSPLLQDEGHCPSCGGDTRSYLERSLYYVKDKVVENFKELQRISIKVAKNGIVFVEERVNRSQKEIQEKMHSFISLISGLLKWAHSE